MPGAAWHEDARVEVEVGVGVERQGRGPNPDILSFQRLDIDKLAKELARCVHEAQIRDAELRDQATRGAKSTFLGICEGLPSDSSGVRRRRFDIANTSLHEVVGAVDLADTIGAIDADRARAIFALAVRVKAMIRKLPR